MVTGPFVSSSSSYLLADSSSVFNSPSSGVGLDYANELAASSAFLTSIIGFKNIM